MVPIPPPTNLENLHNYNQQIYLPNSATNVQLRTNIYRQIGTQLAELITTGHGIDEPKKMKAAHFRTNQFKYTNNYDALVIFN